MGLIVIFTADTIVHEEHGSNIGYWIFLIANSVRIFIGFCTG